MDKGPDVKELRSSSINLTDEAKQLDRRLMARHPFRARSPLRRLFGELDRLDDVILALYGPTTKFQRQLRKLIERSGASVYMLARLAGVDETYVRRLVSGEKRNPSCGFVVALALVLKEGGHRPR